MSGYRAEYMKEYRKKHPEKVLQWQRNTRSKPEYKEKAKVYWANYRKVNKERIRLSTIRYKYGLDAEEYQRWFVVQDYRCAICKKRKKLVVDHHHGTGKVRALICGSCNHILGFSEENVDVLKEAIKYIEKFRK